MSKVFTMSFDDGLEQDKKILDIMHSFGLNCATFNLNSGLFGKQQAIGRIGNMGLLEKPIIDGRLPKDGLFKYHNQRRIPADEIKQVYDGVEIACHGLLHRVLKTLSAEEARREILQDKENLERCTGKPIEGFVFAKGMSSKAAHAVIREAGFSYTRAATSSKSYEVPSDFLYLKPTVWQIEKDAESLLDRFLSDPTEKDCLFFLWGHGYELDFGTPEASYERLKRILDKVAGRDDIICCSNGEAVKQLKR